MKIRIELQNGFHPIVHEFFFQIEATELDKYRYGLSNINFNILKNKSEKANIFLAWKLTTI
jgi:hypothetical protein